jgi:23S rRNA (uracil1939-C5)-methyltransferase
VDGACLAAVFTAPPDSPRADAEVNALAAALPEGTGLSWYVNDRPADAATGVLCAVVRDPAAIEERVGPLRLGLAPTSFFQTSTPGAEVLYATIADLAGRGERLLDLYCGVGPIALWLAPSFRDVVGVEAWLPAVDDARRNAERNGIGNATFLGGPVEDLLPSLDGDVAVVDPPRAGLHPRAAAALAALCVHRVIYVACHPPSLARDRVGLEAAGFRMTDLYTVDLFPQTGHVEAVAAFDRT